MEKIKSYRKPMGIKKYIKSKEAIEAKAYKMIE